MKKLVFLSAVAVAALTSCGGKLGELSADNFKVVPNPLVAESGQYLQQSMVCSLRSIWPRKLWLP